MTIEELIVEFSSLTTEELLKQKEVIGKSLASMNMQLDAVNRLEAICAILETREKNNG